jgi:drug/metabolite transporter (DMT)-like permease
MNKTTKAHLAVLAANFIFGAGYAVVKTITPEFIAPFALNVVRVLSSLLLFWLLFLMKPSNAGFERKHLPRFLLCALTGVAINQLLFIKGLSLTTAIHSSLLSLGTPIFITIIAAWLLKEKLTFNKIAGLTLGIGGATLLILMKDNSTSGKDMLLGDILIIINAISYAFYLVLVRPLMEHYKPIHVLRWVFTFGTFMILPFGLEQFIDTNWAAFGTTQWVAVTCGALFVTFFAYLFNVYGLSVIGSSATGSYIYTQPVFAAIIAMVFMGEHFTITKALAALCIFSGVYLVNIRKRNL